jgi:hypothetical protein
MSAGDRAVLVTFITTKVNHSYSYNNYRNSCAITNETITGLKCVFSVHKTPRVAKDVCLLGLHVAVLLRGILQQGLVISNTHRVTVLVYQPITFFNCNQSIGDLTNGTCMQAVCVKSVGDHNNVLTHIAVTG